MDSKWWLILGLTPLTFLSGCDNGASHKLVEQTHANEQLQAKNASLSGDNEMLKKQIETLNSQIQELSNTPERRLSDISAMIDKRNESAATAAVSELKSRFPRAPEVLKAEQLLASLQATIREEREVAERKQRLGFKALKEVKSFTSPGLTSAVSSPQITGRWTFDSYGDRFHYRDAERGSRYVVARLSITADKDEKNPDLPGLGLYKVSGAILSHVKKLKYEFVRWDDYGSYLGNEADFRNDFAHTATIPFTVGAQVSEEDLTGHVVLVAARAQCETRNYERFANPPITYTGSCSQLKSALTLDDVTSGRYAVLKIWNAGKL